PPLLNGVTIAVPTGPNASIAAAAALSPRIAMDQGYRQHRPTSAVVHPRCETSSAPHPRRGDPPRPSDARDPLACRGADHRPCGACGEITHSLLPHPPTDHHRLRPQRCTAYSPSSPIELRPM